MKTCYNRYNIILNQGYIRNVFQDSLQKSSSVKSLRKRDENGKWAESTPLMTECLLDTITYQQTHKDRGIFNWKNALLIHTVSSVHTLFATTSGLSLKRPQNSFNEPGSVFMRVILTAADAFTLFQWKNVKLYEYTEKNVYEGCCDKLQSLKL